MKATVFGLFGGTVIAFAFWSIVGRGMPAVANSSVYQASGDLLAMNMTIEHDRQSMQQITVIDPRTRAMSVYHIDAKTGAISLKSVRNMEFDLQMTAYNTASPLPSEIGATVQRR